MTDPTQQGPEDPAAGQPNPGYQQPGYQPPGNHQPGAPQAGPQQGYGAAPGQPYAGVPAGAPLSPAEDRQWASFAHLGGILGFLPALIIWLVFKDRGPLTDQEGKEALNFQITAVIAYVIGGILSLLLIGYLVLLAVWVLSIVWSIMGFAKVNAGGTYRYPLAIRLIK